MTQTMTPKLSILPAAQRRLWPELRQVPSEFVLYGGTALALHLGHRDSIDFDFFSDRSINPQALFRKVPFLHDSVIIQQDLDTLTCMVERDGGVKVSFFGLPHLTRLEEPLLCADNGLQVASLLDIAATKAVAVQSRATVKDYLDLDALITAGISLPMALAAANSAFGNAFQPTPTLKALSYFGEGDLPSLPEDVKLRLKQAVSQVDPLRLPSLTRKNPEPGKKR
jgi:hypothetical protein